MNILFGEVPDEVRYLETVDKCCLLPDFDQFGEARDQTEIGEKGTFRDTRSQHRACAPG